MADSSKKGLGLWICTSLVVGNVIGSGVFLLPAALASFGVISLIGWIFTSVGAILLALIFARLAVLVPKAGGPYTYKRAGLGWMILQGQVPHAAARDGLFPKVFTRVNHNGVPYMGIIISSLLITVLMMNYTKGLVETFTFIILLATLTSLIPYAFSAIAQLMIYTNNPEKFHGERLMGHCIIALLGFFYSVWAIAGSGQDTVYWGFILLMLGLPVYSWVKWQNSKQPASDNAL